MRRLRKDVGDLGWERALSGVRVLSYRLYYYYMARPGDQEQAAISSWLFTDPNKRRHTTSQGPRGKLHPWSEREVGGGEKPWARAFSVVFMGKKEGLGIFYFK